MLESVLSSITTIDYTVVCVLSLYPHLIVYTPFVCNMRSFIGENEDHLCSTPTRGLIWIHYIYNYCVLLITHTNPNPSSSHPPPHTHTTQISTFIPPLKTVPFVPFSKLSQSLFLPSHPHLLPSLLFLKNLS